MKKEIVFIIKVMLGGGAERVISLLSRAAADKGYSVTVILTHQSKKDAVLHDGMNGIEIVSLPDETENVSVPAVIPKIIMLWARLLGKLGLKEKSSVLKYKSRNYTLIKALRGYFKAHPKCSAVAFLYDSIFLSLLSKRKSNRLIISERGDPAQSLGNATTMAFIKNEFCKADGFVFQSPDVQKWYEENSPVRGKVIFNPVKSDLPEAFDGERKKRIVNFCRISSQKNLIILVDAFAEFRKEFPDYELDIIGDAVGNDAEGYIEKVNAHISASGLDEYIHVLPSRKDIHSAIRDYAMFVSSSDFEGMSNSMLEAMAIGLPCVCTDCPAGGARAVIKDGENGLLTPVGDAHALYLAMKKVAENPEFAKQLSANSVLIKENQSVKKITEEWMGLING